MTRQQAIGMVEEALRLSRGLGERDRAVFIVAYIDANARIRFGRVESGEGVVEAGGEGTGTGTGEGEVVVSGGEGAGAGAVVKVADGGSVGMGGEGTAAKRRIRFTGVQQGVNVSSAAAKWTVQAVMDAIRERAPEEIEIEVKRVNGQVARMRLVRNIRVEVLPGQLNDVILSYTHPSIGELEASHVFNLADDEIDVDAAMNEIRRIAPQIFRDRSMLPQPQVMVPRGYDQSSSKSRRIEAEINVLE